jgi:hypothetical protein
MSRVSLHEFQLIDCADCSDGLLHDYLLVQVSYFEYFVTVQ